MKKIIFYILISLVAYNLNAQIKEIWNLNVETYIHNTSVYSERNLPIEVIKFDKQSYIILTQNKSLIKTTLAGDVIWKKELPRCARQGIVKSDNESVVVICGRRLKKYNSEGILVWEKNYAEILNDTHALINDITLGENGILYLVGHFWYQSNKIFLSAVDINGNILWKKTFNQANKNSFSVTQPKEILIKKNKIFILAQERGYSGSYLYVTDLKGKNRKEKRFDFDITNIRGDNYGLKTIGHDGSLNDHLIITKFDDELNILKQIAYNLPRNMTYEKATRFFSFKVSKKQFNEKYLTTYTVNDFQYINDENLLVVGSSFGQPWILKVNENSGIIWNWAKSDNRYFKFNNKMTEHNYTFSSISKIGDDYILTGIVTETDNPDWINTYINLFLRKIQIN